MVSEMFLKNVYNYFCRGGQVKFETQFKSILTPQNGNLRPTQNLFIQFFAMLIS